MRTDLLIVRPAHPDARTADKTVIECKILHRSLERTLREGLAQTHAYMDRCGAAAGHLVVFDRTANKSWDDKVFRSDHPVGDTCVTVWGM